jgi:DNA-binding XRE family transcriptional regulator
MTMHRLRVLRLERAMTQAELAQAAGLNTATVVQVENGHRTARPPTVRKLAAALDVPVTALTRCAPVAATEGAA